jgi:hypothetical protein
MKTKLPTSYAEDYSTDMRKRRRQHRRMAMRLNREGGGSIFASVAWWHRQQAKFLSY